MQAEIEVSREILAADAVFILQCLRDAARENRSTHMIDMRTELSTSVTLAFSDYLRFLRKHEYVVLDRELHTLSLTPAGETVATSEPSTGLLGQIDTFFADRLQKLPYVEVESLDEERAVLEAVPVQGRRGAVIQARNAETTPGNARGATPNLSRPPPPPEPVDEPIYLRGQILGRGPLTNVCRARNVTLSADVALKELRDDSPFENPQLAERLRTEIGAQARLRHPCVVGVFDLDLTLPLPVIIAELCDGGNLRDRLQLGARPGLPIDQALRMTVQILSALEAIHGEGLVHANLKPTNVLFDRFGNAKLADLGLSRVAALTHENDGVDPTQLAYLPPELRQGHIDSAKASADIFAAGILLFEALSGRPPGRKPMALSRAVPGTPPAVDWMFERMTAGLPDERYGSATEALNELLVALADPSYGQPGRISLATAIPNAEPSRR